MLSRKNLQAILRITSSLTMSEALQLLRSLDPRNRWTLLYTDTNRRTTFSMLNDKEWPKNRHMVCSELEPIWFRAGPPDWRHWIKGTASQYVADCVFCAIDKLGIKDVACRLNAVLRQGAP